MKTQWKEKGQGLVEYALLLVLIAVVVLGVLVLLGPQINKVYGRAITALGGTVPHTYTITSGPTITASYNSGLNRCTYKLTMSVKVTDGGSPVSGETVSVNVSGGPASGNPTAHTTNDDGVASWTSIQINSIDGVTSCDNGTSTVSVAGGATSADSSY